MAAYAEWAKKQFQTGEAGEGSTAASLLAAGAPQTNGRTRYRPYRVDSACAIPACTVYKTDAMSTSDVKIAYVIDPSTHTAIEYPLGIVAATKHREEAEQFYRYLQTEEALNIFEKYGFSIPSSS